METIKIRVQEITVRDGKPTIILRAKRERAGVETIITMPLHSREEINLTEEFEN